MYPQIVLKRFHTFLCLIIIALSFKFSCISVYFIPCLYVPPACIIYASIHITHENHKLTNMDNKNTFVNLLAVHVDIYHFFGDKWLPFTDGLHMNFQGWTSLNWFLSMNFQGRTSLNWFLSPTNAFSRTILWFFSPLLVTQAANHF